MTYFIRPVKNLKVTYQWLGAPAGATLPKDNTTYAKNATVTVDTAYTDGKTLKVGNGVSIIGQCCPGIKTMSMKESR